MDTESSRPRAYGGMKMADIGRITFGPDRKLDTSAGGHPERTFVGKETTVADVQAEIARLSAENERLKNTLEDATGALKENRRTAVDVLERATQAEAQLAVALPFINECLEAAWDGYDVDGGTIQDCAEKMGLIRRVKYDPEKHGPLDALGEGDEWYERAPLPTRAADLLAVVESVRNVCAQKIAEELTGDEYDSADFEGAYDIIIVSLREALAKFDGAEPVAISETDSGTEKRT